MNFSHIALNCRDIDVTERFYVEHFGFARARNIPLRGNARITFIRNGSMLLELFAAEGDRPDGEGDGPHGAGIRHIAFQVEDVDAVLAGRFDDPRFTPFETAALRFTEQYRLDHTKVDRALVDATLEELSEGQFIELGLCIAQFTGMGQLFATLGLPSM